MSGFILPEFERGKFASITIILIVTLISAVNSNAHVTDEWKKSGRGIAAIVVAIAHAYGLYLSPFFGPDDYLGIFFAIASHQAVMIFFLISGYLITISININIKKNEGMFRFFQYLASRIARIYPPLLFAIAMTTFFWGVIRFFNLHGVNSNLPYEIGNFAPSRAVFSLGLADIKNAVMMQNGMLDANGPLWSLYIEWRIYIVAGVLAFFLTVNAIIYKSVLAIIFAYVFYGLFSINEHAMFYLMIWLLGCIFSLAPFLTKLALIKHRYLVFSVLLIVIFLWGILNPKIVISGGSKFGFFENVFQLLICFSWSMLIIPDRLTKLTTFKIISIWLGNLSYSLYILHFPIMLFFLSLFHNLIAGSLPLSLLAAVVSLFVAIAISSLSAKYFENKVYFERIIQKILIRVIAMLQKIAHKIDLLTKK